MILISLAMLALTSPHIDSTSSAPGSTAAAPIVREDHGKLNWFQGSYEDLLKEAKAKNKIVFIDLWTTWCGWCKRLDKDTYSDESVAAEMKDILCFNIDAESKEGVPLAKKYQVQGYPALILLSPDGSIRDQIGGYLKPEDFKRAIQRVRSGKGTVYELRQAVEADKSSVEKRFALAQKLREMKDTEAADEQMAAIQKLDPEGKSQAMHMRALMDVVAKINEGWQKSQTLDMALLQSFIDKETYPDVLYDALNSMMGMQNYLAQTAKGAGRLDDAKKLRGDLRRSMVQAWKNCPEKAVASYGRLMAKAYYEDRDVLEPADKTLALEVARKAQAAEPDDANGLDALACCLYMNGLRDDALKFNTRCITLDPQNPAWPARQKEFLAGK